VRRLAVVGGSRTARAGSRAAIARTMPNAIESASTFRPAPPGLGTSPARHLDCTTVARERIVVRVAARDRLAVRAARARDIARRVECAAPRFSPRDAPTSAAAASQRGDVERRAPDRCRPPASWSSASRSQFVALAASRLVAGGDASSSAIRVGVAAELDERVREIADGFRPRCSAVIARRKHATAPRIAVLREGLHNSAQPASFSRQRRWHRACS